MSEEALLRRWLERLYLLKDKHFHAAAVFRRWHYRTGIPLVILSALVSAGIWAVVIDIWPSARDVVTLVLAVLGSVIAILSAVQAFLGFDKRSEMHKNAATRYSSLKGDVDLLLNQSSPYDIGDLTKIKEKWGIITENAPFLPGEDPQIANKPPAGDVLKAAPEE